MEQTMSDDARARLAQIASDNYEDEWGYPVDGTFERIADAILAEFSVAPRLPESRDDSVLRSERMT
jgi:hypothetical protein